jgi:AMMECR1 domain-containing protein
VSILSFPRLIQVDSAVHYLGALRPHEDGVVMMYKGKQSTYLPHVWKSIPEPEEFLRRLSLKQGAPGDAWKRDGVRLYRYSVEAFSESPEH